ncbi:MAG: biotin synthase BioB [Phycisphaerae bacterium]
MDPQLEKLGRAVLDGRNLSADELRQAVHAASDDPIDLFYWSWQVRKKHFGRKVRLCSIAPGKIGGCSEDCKWCAQSSHSDSGRGPARRSSTEDIRQSAIQARKHEATSFGIVNSGRYPTEEDFQAVIDAARAIQDNPHDQHPQVCASLGELTEHQARRLYDAGIRRYNHNLETSRRYFNHVVSTHAYDDRLATLNACKKAGLGLCCGGLFGMGETWDDRIDLALTLRDKVQPDVAPLNFLNPIDGTPLGTSKPLPAMEALQVVAIFRLALPQVDLKLAGGREINLRACQSWIFHAGATSFLVGNYLTTFGQDPAADHQMIRDLGFEVVSHW